MIENQELPKQLLAGPNKVNLYYLHQLFQVSANMVSQSLNESHGWEIPISAGMWGGSYLVANHLGISRTNVVRLYSIVNLPQNTPLDDSKNFEHLMQIYQTTFQNNFNSYGLKLVDPHWGERVPYSNNARPTTTLQLWDATNRVKFVRAFFVWNQASWAESIIYDSIRNIKQIKELLDINHRPPKKDSQELKFMLQDTLIIYFTLKPALNPDFIEHAEPIVKELFNHFISGLHDPEIIEEQYHKVFRNALVYGYEEALEAPYKKYNLDIHNYENWPAEKINWVPPELKKELIPYLEGTFETIGQKLKQEEN